jgi:geranylgeranyl pyrophosphate synthase
MTAAEAITGRAAIERAPGARPSPLLAALAAALVPGGASALEPGVPAAVWRAALSGPAAAFLARPGKDLRTQLVRAGWVLGGRPAAAMPDALGRVIEILHAGSLIVDDVEDAATHRRGGPALHQLVGVPLAINTGSWMYFWALAELAELAIPGAVEAAIAALVRCHQGQGLDLAARVDGLAMADVPGVVAATTRLKTGGLCRLATELGARAAGAAPDVVARVGAFGERAGIALQMFDDLGSIGARRDKAREDLAHARPTWPWAWLAELDDPFVWARLTHALAHVATGQTCPDALADELGALVAPVGRRRARDVLAGALALLGGGDEARVIGDELRAMEARYG